MESTTTDNGGQWVTMEVGYVDPQRRSCALCGRPIARRIWREDVEGRTREFCEPAHVALYRDYWLPLYGAEAATSSSLRSAQLP